MVTDPPPHSTFSPITVAAELVSWRAYRLQRERDGETRLKWERIDHKYWHLLVKHRSQLKTLRTAYLGTCLLKLCGMRDWRNAGRWYFQYLHYLRCGPKFLEDALRQIVPEDTGSFKIFYIRALKWYFNSRKRATYASTGSFKKIWTSSTLATEVTGPDTLWFFPMAIR